MSTFELIQALRAAAQQATDPTLRTLLEMAASRLWNTKWGPGSDMAA